MNLDELRTVQSKERSKDSLQHLRESFYADVADYVADLRERRDQLAEQADNPFDDPEVNRLTDEIKTAEEVVEAVYERRVGKVVKRASLAAAGMPADEEGLTSEEQKLFAELVERIESNKQEVLDVLAGDETPTDVTATATDTPTAATDAAAESAPAPGEPPTPGDAPDSSGDSEVSAADVMGGGGSATDSVASGTTTTSGSSEATGSDSDEDARPMDEAAVVAGAGPPEDADPSESADPSEGASAADGESASGEADEESDDETGLLAGLDERTTVRVTDDVGEIFGVDERTYDLESEDVVTLPEANAEPLVERGAAEKLD